MMLHFSGNAYYRVFYYVPCFCLLFESLESEALIWQLFGYLEKDVTIHKRYVMLKNNGFPELCINNREVGKFR